MFPLGPGQPPEVGVGRWGLSFPHICIHSFTIHSLQYEWSNAEDIRCKELGNRAGWDAQSPYILPVRLSLSVHIYTGGKATLPTAHGAAARRLS